MKVTLKRLISDEKVAPKEYSSYLKNVKNPQQRKVIKGIISDEKRHFKLLNKIRGGK